MANTEKKKFQFKMPHTYVILVSIMVLMLVLTHIIPAGQYDRVGIRSPARWLSWMAPTMRSM